MPDRHDFRVAAILAGLTLLALDLAMASPDRVRSRAASLVQSVALGQCDNAAPLADWPLELEDRSIELDGWESLCKRLRKPFMTARIDAAFQSDEMTSVMPPRHLERESVHFVDLVLAHRPGREQVSGMSLAFECSESDCRLVAIHERLLHYRHYDRRERDDDEGARLELERAMRAARLAEVLQNIVPLKTMLTEHYHVTGDWPASVEALGLEPDRLHGRGIERIEILPGGGIRAHLSAEFGNGRSLDLLPAEQMDGLSIRWNCRTNLPGEMTAVLGGVNCRRR
jgi:hypothetical protein